VAHDQNRDVGPLGQELEGVQGPADVLVAVGVDLPGQEGHERVDDDQANPEAGGVGVVGVAGAPALDAVGVGGQLDRAGAALVEDVVDHGDQAQVGPGGLQPRPDGVGDAVLGAQQQHRHRPLGPVAVGERRGGGEPGGQVEGEGRLAEPGVAVDDDDLPGRDTTRPHPADPLGLDLVGPDRGQLARLPALGEQREGLCLDGGDLVHAAEHPSARCADQNGAPGSGGAGT
jgi:hypothetical protein